MGWPEFIFTCFADGVIFLMLLLGIVEVWAMLGR